MLISQEHYDQIIAHALEDPRRECCGLIGMRGDRVEVVYRATNAAKSSILFELDPLEQLELHEKITGAGLELGAIYHSHPGMEPIPSSVDLHYADGWPGVLWIIVGLDRWASARGKFGRETWAEEAEEAEETQTRVTVRTWRIESDGVYETNLMVEGGERYGPPTDVRYRTRQVLTESRSTNEVDRSREALDALLRRYPDAKVVMVKHQHLNHLLGVERQKAIRSDFLGMYYDDGPWTEVTLHDPDALPGVAFHQYAIWNRTGAVHDMEDGEVLDPPLIPANE